MKAYVDSSVLLRVVLGQPDRLRQWPEIERAFSSELIRVESLRAIDRARVKGALDDEGVALRRSGIVEQLEHFSLVGLSRPVLRRSEDPFPTSIGTLDALHLSTALLLSERFDDLVLCTHDRELATAGRASGMRVLG